MRRHKLLVALAVLLVVFVLAACSTPTPEPTPTQAPAAQPTPQPSPEEETDPISKLDPSGQEVLFWHVSTRKHEKVLMEIIDGFNSSNPYGIKVVPEYAGYYGDIYKKILAGIAAGETPDLAVAYANQVAEYANAGVIVPLDQFINSEKYGFTEEEKNDFMWNLLEGDRNPKFGNQLLSFAHSRSMQVMYYNVDWLKELGYDGPPQNWEQFKEMCMAATDPEKGTFGYAYAGSASLFAGWLFTFGGDIVSEDNTKIAFNSEAGLKTLQLLKDLFDSGCTYEVAERYGDQKDFANRKALFTFGSTAGIPYYRSAIEESEAGPFECNVAAPPHETPEPVVDVYGPSVTIFQSVPERELAAWLFFKYWAEPENVAKWAMVANYFPIRKSAIELPEMQEYMKKNPQYKTAFDLLPYGRMEPSVAGYQQIRGIIGDMMKQVIEGMDPQQALEAAAAEAQSVLDQNK